MALEDDFKEHMKARTSVTSLIGLRLYPLGEVPQKRTVNGRVIHEAKTPFIVYHVDTFRHHHNGGYAGISRSEIRLSCFGENYERTRSLADVVIDAIDGFRGSWADTSIRSCMVTSKADVFDEPLDGSDRGVHWRELIATVWHKEPQPALA